MKPMKIIFLLLIVSINVVQSRVSQDNGVHYSRGSSAVKRWETVMKLMRVEKSLLMILRKLFMEDANNIEALKNRREDVEKYFNIVYDPVKPVYKATPIYKTFKNHSASTTGKRLQ